MHGKATKPSLYVNVAYFVLSLGPAMPRRPRSWALRAHVGQTARAWSPARRSSLVGASGGELCAACFRLRGVGWGLVDPELGLSIRFHSMGENFHTGRFSRPLCDCTGAARRVRRPPNFRAHLCLAERALSHLPLPDQLYSPASADSVIAASLSQDPTFKRCGASHRRSEREKQR